MSQFGLPAEAISSANAGDIQGFFNALETSSNSSDANKSKESDDKKKEDKPKDDKNDKKNDDAEMSLD